MTIVERNAGGVTLANKVEQERTDFCQVRAATRDFLLTYLLLRFEYTQSIDVIFRFKHFSITMTHNF